MSNFIKEAFKELKLLKEEAFDLNDEEDIEELGKFVEDDSLDGIEMIIDVDASDEEELQDTYVGKFLLWCPICHAIHYADEDTIKYEEKEEVADIEGNELEEEETLVNLDEICPECHEKGQGFIIKGKVAEYNDEKVEEPEEEVEEKEEVEIEDEEIKEESLKESLKTTKKQTKNEFKDNFSLLESLIEGDLSKDIDEVEVEDDEIDDTFKIEEQELQEKGLDRKLGRKLAKKENLEEKKELKEEPVYDLSPEYDSRQSFYGKAKVEVRPDGSQILWSYSTPVVFISKDGKEAKLLRRGYYGWSSSQTTLRHVKDFLRQNGFETGSYKDLAKKYEVVDYYDLDKEVKESLKEEFDFLYDEETKKLANKLVSMAKKDGHELSLDDACEIIDQSFNGKADTIENFYANLSFDESFDHTKKSFRKLKESQEDYYVLGDGKNPRKSRTFSEIKDVDEFIKGLEDKQEEYGKYRELIHFVNGKEIKVWDSEKGKCEECESLKEAPISRDEYEKRYSNKNELRGVDYDKLLTKIEEKIDDGEDTINVIDCMEECGLKGVTRYQATLEYQELKNNLENKIIPALIKDLEKDYDYLTFKNRNEILVVEFEESLKEAPISRDDIDAKADNKKELAKKRFMKKKDDADADKDYQLKKAGLKEAKQLSCLKETYEDLDDNYWDICRELVDEIKKVFPEAEIDEDDIYFDDSRAWSLYVFGSKLDLPVYKFGAYRDYLGGGVRGGIESNGREKDGTLELAEKFEEKLKQIEELINKDFNGSEWDTPTGVLAEGKECESADFCYKDEITEESCKKESLTESEEEVKEVAKFLKNAVKDLKEDCDATWYYDLGEKGLNLVVGCLEGEEGIFCKIALNCDDLQCDYDIDWNMPYDEKGEVYDTEMQIDEDNLESVAQTMLNEFKELKEYDFEDDGKIIEEDEEEIEFEDLDEALFDNLVTRYCNKVYENVDSYKTSKCNLYENKLFLEGTLTYKSGKSINTKFIFENIEKTKSGLIKFQGLNETFSDNKKAFTLTTKVEDKKVLAESLSYNYKVKVNEEVKKLQGRIVSKRK